MLVSFGLIVFIGLILATLYAFVTAVTSEGILVPITCGILGSLSATFTFFYVNFMLHLLKI